MKMHKLKSIFYVILVSFCFSTFPTQTIAFWAVAKNVAKSGTKAFIKLGKVEGALPEKKIIELADMIQNAGDIKKVGKILGKMKLSDQVLEDTYMRIVVHQGKISKHEAEVIFRNLRGVDGLRTTLRKIAGVSNVKTSGHLNEVRIANAATENGFKVLSIGEKFQDGVKHVTDIDVIVKKNGKTFAIEAKNYSSNSNINIQKFRADMDTLLAYKKHNGKKVVPVFSITTLPKDPVVRRILEKEAERKGIQLIYGLPEEQIHQIKLLSEIL
jgi:hypothetical protein